jgi:ATP-dependent helicase/nuclease subunit A
MIDEQSKDYRRTVEAQRAAASPGHSVWVSANAGAGKTHVLTQRVIRLMIGEAGRGRADPAAIVCITYTKAAAAQMRDRLFRQLGQWALSTDEALQADIEKMIGRRLEAAHLPAVRQLFARALDTPGGLRIQTIHSFCEAILRRFPAEARVLPGFRVVEDDEVGALKRAVLDDMARAAGAFGNSVTPVDMAFRDLYRLIGSDTDRDQLISELIENADALEAVRRACGDEDGLEMAIRQALGLPDGTPNDWREATLAGLDRDFLERLDRLRGTAKGKHGDRVAAAVHALEGRGTVAERVDLLMEAWLLKGGKLPKLQTNNDIRALVPDYMEGGEAICEALHTLHRQLAAQDRLRVTRALYILAGEIDRRFARQKRARNLLDFTDLIRRTVSLFKDVSGAWILFKLDQGIEHLLLDEAQDTSRPQWEMVEELIEEFFAAEGTAKTLFVVGDMKQSIYAFQGADATLFREQRLVIGERIERVAPYRDVPLTLSFRTAQPILDFVDRLFVGSAGEGVVDGDELTHVTAKTGAFGSVELWPLFVKEATEKVPWDAPVDEVGPRAPEARLAAAICTEIERLLSMTPRPGEAKIMADDIMILCQRRNTQFREIVRQLSQRGIANAGTDRVKLKDDVAVRDLLALLRFAVNTRDDLSLAEVLKSPLFGWSDADLMEVAWDRKGVPLWTALRRRSLMSDVVGARAAVAVGELHRVLRVGYTRGPFAFLSSVLEEGEACGWHRFRARLGRQCDEALEELLAEALAFEGRELRTLQGFLQRLERLDTDIKKEGDQSATGVRTMTVHGAKGLEARVVFLADAAYRKERFTTPLLHVDRVLADWPVPVSTLGGAGLDGALLGAARARAVTAEGDEYRRRLYVAATRAEERLYICGTETTVAKPDAAPKAKTPQEASWYELSAQALDRLEGVEEAPFGDTDLTLRRFSGGDRRPAAKALKPDPADKPCPDWLNRPAPPEPRAQVTLPASGPPDYAPDDLGPVLPPRARRRDDDVRSRGEHIHHLLEVLPLVGRSARAATAKRILAVRAPEWTEADHADWIAQVTGVLDDPAFGALFGADSRAEVPLRGRVGGQAFSGQVDRLRVTDEAIHFVDFKTHRAPPGTVAALSPGIARQMAVYAQLLSAIYPGRRVEAAVLWTSIPRLMPLPPAFLQQHLEAMG